MISPMNEQLRRIVISGDVKQDAASQFLEQVTALECVDFNKPISVYIDTYGGSVDAAITMYDTMKSCACPIITIGIGKVMSAGVLLLAAGEPGSRFITENTRVMVHELAAGIYGSISEMEITMNESKRMQEMYLDLLSKDSGVDKAKLLADMKKTTYLTAKEAVKYGLADKVVPTRKVAKPKKNTKKNTKKATSKKRTRKVKEQ